MRSLSDNRKILLNLHYHACFYHANSLKNTGVGQIALTVSQFLEKETEQMVAFISYNHECKCRLKFINTCINKKGMAQMPV